jgi:chemotaxis signal transduction protein
VSAEADRVLAFEVGGVAWALPIADVREVTEVGELRAVPTLPRSLASVMNHRGDALPVVTPSALLDLREGSLPPARQLLVIGGSGDEPGLLGLPVDRVLGLAQAPRARRGSGGVVRARGTLDGRMLRMLGGAQLVARAEEAIARAQGRS